MQPDDLIVRARRVAEVGGVASSCVLLELADRVEALERDNRRLRAACEMVRETLVFGDLNYCAHLLDEALSPAAAGGEGT